MPDRITSNHNGEVWVRVPLLQCGAG
jgi:hypothetical protein